MNVRMAVTRYHGPTNFRGSRVSAKHVTTGRRVTLAWDDAHDCRWNHERAARAVLESEGLGAAESLDEPFARLVWASVDGGGYIFAAVPSTLFREEP